VWGKAIYVSDRLRRDGRPGLAIRMLLAAVRLHPSFALSARLWKNLVRAALETGVRAGTRG
jgi:hypothetical protein